MDAEEDMKEASMEDTNRANDNNEKTFEVENINESDD